MADAFSLIVIYLFQASFYFRNVCYDTTVTPNKLNVLESQECIECL